MVSLRIVIGLIGTFAVTRLLSQMLYAVTPFDPITYAMVAGLLLATALMACIVPARRATRVDPVVALRDEWNRCQIRSKQRAFDSGSG